jgi:hypothetical protein
MKILISVTLVLMLVFAVYMSQTAPEPHVQHERQETEHEELLFAFEEPEYTILKPVTYGNVVDFIILQDGLTLNFGEYDVYGILLLELSDGLTAAVEAPQSANFIAAYYPDFNDKIGILGVGVTEGDVIFSIEFSGTGTWTLTGVYESERAKLGHMESISGEILPSVLTPITNGNVVDFIVNQDGDIHGTLLLELSEGLTAALETPSGSNSFAVYNPDNGVIPLAAISLSKGDVVFSLEFQGSGTWILTGVDGYFEDMERLRGNISNQSQQPADGTPTGTPSREIEDIDIGDAK